MAVMSSHYTYQLADSNWIEHLQRVLILYMTWMRLQVMIKILVPSFIGDYIANHTPDHQ